MDTYEKKYNEALERASHIKDNNTVATPQEVAEHIFPELRESEDERIRKAVVSLVYEMKGTYQSFAKVELDKMVAWLEKQKEQKPVDYDHEMWKNCEANFEGGKKEVIDHPEKYGLRKEQKPAEWSEEDTLMLTAVIQTLENFGPYGTIGMQIDWLKSLCPQSKAEWCEEDERIVGRIQMILEFFDRNYPADMNIGSEVPKYISWLKSLRPSWKPSEEHLSALLAVFNDPDNIGSQTCQLALTDLYEQLLKLK